MGALTLTQERFDDIVIGMVERQIDFMDITAQLRKQDDSAAYNREEENLMLQNLIDALKHYDVDSEILTDEEIYYYQELATLVVESCPM